MLRVNIFIVNSCTLTLQIIYFRDPMKHSPSEATQLDINDPFQALTDLFDIPVNQKGQPLIYLNGNSLGPKPKNIDQALIKQCNLWGQLGVRGHFDQAEPWISYNELLRDSLAHLIGAKTEEVVATGTLTANLHALFVSFYRPTKKRFKIIRLCGFPSDTYAIDSQIKQRLQTIADFNDEMPIQFEEAVIEIKPNEAGYIDLATFEKTIEAQGECTAIIWLEAVHYLTGQFFDIPAITHMAHKKGCKVGLDLAHAIGNVPLALHTWDIDFAVWCSYKYLSAGPGAISGLYVHEKYLQDTNIIRFVGWWGHNKSTRFDMPAIFDPIPTAEGWQVSNAGIFLLAALRQSLAIFDQIDFLALVEKNKRLVFYLETLLHDELGEIVKIITPKNPNERGCQLSLLIKSFQQNIPALTETSVLKGERYISMEKKLLDLGIVCDVRGNVVRVAPMGLYTTFRDVFCFVERLKMGLYST